MDTRWMSAVVMIGHHWVYTENIIETNMLLSVMTFNCIGFMMFLKKQLLKIFYIEKKKDTETFQM